jgi:nucleotide-binding universal stress UspA family protein
LFIEDRQLLTAGSLPFAREVGSRSGIARRIGTADIEHSLRAVASRARQAVSQAGESLHVTASFHVARGDIRTEILAAAHEADLIVIGKSGWAFPLARRIGSTCLTVVSQSQVPVLIVERGTVLTPPLLVVRDESPEGKRALDYAQTLGERLGWQVVPVSPDALAGTDSGQVLVVPSTFAITACGLRAAIVVVP